MLSGWSTSRRLTCLYCMNQSKTFRLKMGEKFSWFDSHCQFLPMHHSFKRNNDAFYKNQIEKSQSPYFLTGNELLQQFFF